MFIVILKLMSNKVYSHSYSYSDWKSKLPLSWDIQVALLGRHSPFEGHSSCPFWGTFKLPFLGDIQVALFRGHSSCPFGVTFKLTFRGDIQVDLLGGHSGWPY